MLNLLLAASELSLDDIRSEQASACRAAVLDLFNTGISDDFKTFRNSFHTSSCTYYP
jgi:hypothetical protein